jgi:hypothetical protein
MGAKRSYRNQAIVTNGSAVEARRKKLEAAVARARVAVEVIQAEITKGTADFDERINAQALVDDGLIAYQAEGRHAIDVLREEQDQVGERVQELLGILGDLQSREDRIKYEIGQAQVFLAVSTAVGNELSVQRAGVALPFRRPLINARHKLDSLETRLDRLNAANPEPANDVAPAAPARKPVAA